MNSLTTSELKKRTTSKANQIVFMSRVTWMTIVIFSRRLWGEVGDVPAALRRRQGDQTRL